MTAYTATDGLDVDIRLTPDTPAAWAGIPPGTLAALDQLACTLAGPWQIRIHFGPDTTLTAQPASQGDSE